MRNRYRTVPFTVLLGGSVRAPSFTVGGSPAGLACHVPIQPEASRVNAGAAKPVRIVSPITHDRKYLILFLPFTRACQFLEHTCVPSGLGRAYLARQADRCSNQRVYRAGLT